MNIYIENLTGEKIHIYGYKKLIERAVRICADHFKLPDILDVNVLIVSSDEIRRINSEQRKTDRVTDVLSFPYFEFETPGVFPDEEDIMEGDILGDIVLCADKVIAQAAEYGHSTKRELSYLTVHSMLHLAGFDHMENDEAEVMEKTADDIMKVIGIDRSQG